MRKLSCTLDTETLNGINNPMLAYNIAGIIHDNFGNIVAVFNYLIAELFDQIRYDDYAKKNFGKYQEMINNGSVTLVATVDDALNAINALLTFYNVEEVNAYNANFDLVRGACSKLMENRVVVDTWLNALETICQKASYRKFCVEHGFINPKSGVCKTSAETVYAYLTGNADYEEEHTAMEDSKIEMAILVACKKTHKKMTKGHCTFDPAMKGAVKWPRP
jgi:hypothetical protein